MSRRIYISTTLPYANDEPHVGHAIEFFQADAYARYFRKKNGNKSVFYNVGIDEHGLKVYTAARENRTIPKKYVDELAGKWQDFCRKFDIDYDFFYRTSSEEHHINVQNILHF